MKVLPSTPGISVAGRSRLTSLQFRARTVNHLGRIRLPATAWTPPFVLALVVAIVELYLLVFLQFAKSGGGADSFPRYQWLLEMWTGGGELERGLPFEFMKVNLLLGVHLWLMSRAMSSRHEAVHRLGLILAALVIVALQILLAMSSDLPAPDFVLIPIEL